MSWLLLSTLALGAQWTVGEDAPTLAATLDLAADGDRVRLPLGEWQGPAVVERSITLVGEGGVLLPPERGDSLQLLAPGAVVQGLHIAGSGDDMNEEDACVWIGPEARGAVVRDSTLRDCLFGIWVHTTTDVQLIDNDIEGRAGVRDADKGNGIHLFDATGLVVRGNQVRHARDGIYVSATEDSLIADNDVSTHRYGIHYMFSYDNRLEGNIAHNNNGGIALMQSRRLVVAHNRASGNRKQGILFRDAQGCDIHHNVLHDNGEGMFFFSSVDNDIHHNHLQGNQHGVRVWAGSYDNRVWANNFIGNQLPVFYVSAYDQEWGHPEEGGNHWSDHLAWDQDGDGISDRPYRADSALARTLHQWPAAILLLNSPAMELIRAAQQRLPALRSPSIVDPRPLVRPVELP